MDALQVIASATQIVSSMVGAVSALEQASRDFDEAPERIRNLEEFVCDLENLTRCIKQRHGHKLHNPRLERQIQSLTGLIDGLHPKIRKLRGIMSKNKIKNVAKVVWFSIAGDPLSRLFGTMHADLSRWLELQKISDDVERAIESTADNVTSLLRLNVDQGYPVSNKGHYIRQLLEQEDSHRVILIVGLSGIGKSCLARQVASNPPRKFVDGAVELDFGHWCSRAACNGNKAEYHKRLAKKICRLLVQIGFIKKIKEDMNMDLEDVCCTLQTALAGKSILMLLDDVWEQDIVERFTKLYDNDCRYLVTTRNEGVYEITEAEKVEICKGDIKEISKEILCYHSLLTNEELPAIAEDLLDRCGHHPLTVAVMGKALRKEARAEKWEKAINNLSTYATCAPAPVSYMNEKESENTLTIFGSFEFSLQAMPKNSQRLFIILAAISWAEPIPEVCLEVLWSGLGHDSIFPLVVSNLVEGSLLFKTDADRGYHVHDMVALYLESKTSDAIEILLTASSDEIAASAAPWLFIFGRENVKIVAEEKMKSLISLSHERQAVIALESIGQALMASKSISELEASRKSFGSIVGPKVTEFISAGSLSIIAASAKLITNLFVKEDYYEYALENTEAIDKLLELLRNCSDPATQTIIFTLVAKLAEHGSSTTINKVLPNIPMNCLADLLSANADNRHDYLFTTVMSLTKAGKLEAVQLMVASGVDKRLIELLENGNDVAQHHAIVTLKAFYEMGGPVGYLQRGTLKLLPWHARLSLEKFVLSDRSTLSPKPQTFEDIMDKILSGDNKQILEAMQDLIPFLEKAANSGVRDMILQSPLIERLAVMLSTERNRVRSESAFMLMKLACSGGEPFIRKFLEYDIVIELVKMMQCHVAELQDSASTALHQIVFGAGGTIVSNQILKMGMVEKLAHFLDSKCVKTKEVSMHCILDLVEMGSKPCIERMFSLQVVEKLVCLEKAGGSFKGVLVNFLKGLDKCKNLSSPERRVMKQQVVRKVRASMKSHKLESSIIAAVEECISEGSWRASSSKPKK